MDVCSFPVGLAVGEPVVDVLAVGSGVGEPLEALGALERLLTRVEPAVLRRKERDVKFNEKALYEIWQIPR